MNQLFKKVNFNSAYSIASEIIKVICDNNPFDRLDELLYLQAQSNDEFMKDFLNANISVIINPQKYTLLHSFIKFFIINYISNDFCYFKDSYFDELDEQLLYDYVESKTIIFSDCCLDITIFIKEAEHIEFELVKAYENDVPNIKPLEDKSRILLENMENSLYSNIEELTDSIFYLLYSNKKFLFEFNLFVATYIIPEILPSEIFDAHLHIKRCSALPKWLQNGIIYRDRATCQHCGFDLSNSYRILEMGKMHFDHIIPLEKGGTNDSANFQLLCSECNLRKNDNLVLPDYHYQMYW